MKKLLTILILTQAFGATKLLAETRLLTPTKTTAEVWQRHIDAWNQRNLSKIISDYDDESILILNGRIHQGPKQISEVFKSLFKIFDQGKNQIDPVVTQGRIVYITWNFTSAGIETQFGTDTFVIEDGKIQVQTIASPLYNYFPIGGEKDENNF